LKIRKKTATLRDTQNKKTPAWLESRRRQASGKVTQEMGPGKGERWGGEVGFTPARACNKKRARSSKGEGGNGEKPSGDRVKRKEKQK